MFLTHQPVIGRFALSSAENMFKVLRFVQCTIQMRFYRIVPVIEDVKAGKQGCLTALRFSAIHEYFARKDEIFAYLTSDRDDVDKLAFLACLPGLGIVKAGFVMQLVFGRVGCMDTWNMQRYGLKPSAFAAPKLMAARLFDRCKAYVALCSGIGCEKLWDEWCNLIAAKYPKNFANGEAVSMLHVDAIIR